MGVDQSEELIAIARRRVPEATFQIASLYQYPIPTCQAVTSVGECLNYLPDSARTDATGPLSSLIDLFQRVFQALVPGGMLIFDIAEPGQLSTASPVKTFTEGEDWLVLVEKSEDTTQAILTRRIITLRRVGEMYRRDDEIHRLQLYLSQTLAQQLMQLGFETHCQTHYGDFLLPSAHTVLVARKPL